MKKLNLTTEPWLPVLADDGSTRHVSLRELFEQAPTIARLDPTHGPHHEIAMLRMLVALTHRATHGPTDLTDWKAMRADWSAKVAAPVLDYLQQWEDRFWLVHPEHPFWQVSDPIAGADTPANRVKGLRALGTGDFNIWHTDTAEGEQPIGLVDAANRVLVAQVARPSGLTRGGIPTTHPAHFGGKGSSDKTLIGLSNVTYPVGTDLASTLMANLTAYQHHDSDRPVWERGSVMVADLRGHKPDKGTPLLPVGRVEWLTGMQRAITLQTDDTTGTITRVNLSMGDKYDSTAPALEALDPHMLWSQHVAEKGPAPREWIAPQIIGAAAPARLSWRGNAMNAPVTHQRYTKAQGRIDITQRVPTVVAWLSTLAQAGQDVGHLTLRTVGAQLTAKAAVLCTTVVDEVFFDTEHVDGPRRDRVERAATELRRIATAIAPLVGQATPDLARQHLWENEAWSRLQPLADQYLSRAGRAAKPDEVVQQFTAAAAAVARDIVAEALDGLSLDQLAGATASIRTFDARLRALTDPRRTSARPEVAA